MEKVFSDISRQIYNFEVRTADQSLERLTPLMSSDNAFYEAFRVHLENKPSRVHYLLVELDATYRRSQENFSWDDYLELRSASISVSPTYIIPPEPFVSEDDDRELHLLGNRMLVEDDVLKHPYSLVSEAYKEACAHSAFVLTQQAAADMPTAKDTILHRSNKLADLAINTWRFDNPLQNPRRAE